MTKLPCLSTKPSRSSLLPAYAAAGAVNAEADGNNAVVVSDHDTLRRERAGPRAVCRALDRDMAGDLVAGVGEGRARESGRRPLEAKTTSLAVRALATGAGAADGTVEAHPCAAAVGTANASEAAIAAPKAVARIQPSLVA
jgi:hypothetical protein